MEAAATTTHSTSVKADSRLTRFDSMGESPIRRTAGMITIELDPPRMAPSVIPWSHDHPAGSQPASAAAIEAMATVPLAMRKPARPRTMARGAARDASPRLSSLPRPAALWRQRGRVARPSEPPWHQLFDSDVADIDYLYTPGSRASRSTG